MWSRGSSELWSLSNRGREKEGKDCVKGLSRSGAGGKGQGDWEGAAPVCRNSQIRSHSYSVLSDAIYHEGCGADLCLCSQGA